MEPVLVVAQVPEYNTIILFCKAREKLRGFNYLI